MRILIVLFGIGVWLFQQQADLPVPAWRIYGWCGWTVALPALFRLAHRPVQAGDGGVRRLALAAAAGCMALCAGFLWSAQRAEWRLTDALPMVLEGVDIALTGRVDELPQQLADGVRFAFVPDAGAEGVPRRILLSWYRLRDDEAPPDVAAGERWRFVVRLKRPHGFVNPAGFDYEAWLLERGLRASGYVRGDAGRLDSGAASFMHRVHRARAAIRDRFLAVLGDAPYAGVLVALVVGDQRAIPAGQWEVFRRTGISHLVAISGMHISLAGLLGAALAGALWRRVPALVLRLPARKAAAVAAIAAATGYALLAGMGIPVLRALIMLCVVGLALLLGRSPSPSRVLLLALAGVLIADPWAVLAAGFWLSFAAVGVILLVLGARHGVRGRGDGWRAAVKTQIAITLATVPLLIALFQSFSVVSPLANALAIPVVSFLVTPLAFLAALLPFEWPLQLAHASFSVLMQPVEWLSATPLALWRQAAAPAWLLLAGAAAAAVVLLPRATPVRAPAGVVLAALLLWQPGRPAPGDFAATVLDVGQGLAVHVQTATHSLLYDAGPPYGDEADAGERVILPFLAASGVARLDRLVLSHDDADHVGGARSVLEGVEVGAMLASGDDAAGFRHDTVAPGGGRLACGAGQRWEWDGVRFEVLHPWPGGRPARRNNDLSCVVKVTAGGGSLLLVGDLEAPGEAAMIARHGVDALASSVVVVGHHGSRSSSSPAFVDAVMPEAAIHSAGYRNRFGHPHPAVWARWAGAGARNWRTDSQGAIGIRVTAAGIDVAAAREQRPRYWHGR
ncbi:DNA internalization-related competence protein ComEC/Rec2 [Thauera sinica]|uniref:DNA internalization-related competence protein ComEC/Rec2 n=1 Tax=Thauera sinica TaxID=2665146 RepID=A0ABW1AR05_9RHOO|nr:DNA internalization-related competence protein ComEC/Rec2 [Thauera sp. K11]ATE59600.1 DNA internalization-related competence protein ComEC/Rec2 [Thauera sp. K11]